MSKNIFIYALVGVLLAACGKTTGLATDTSNAPVPTPVPGTVPTVPGTAPTVTDTTPLALQIYTIYDKTKAVEYQTFTETGTTVCQSTTTTPNVTCSVPVQEGRLYLSSINFQFSWTTKACKIMLFQPYYYKASTSATFLPYWSDTAIDCSLAPFPADCWGGVATFMVPSFPKYTGFLFQPDESLPPGPQTSTQTVESGDAKRFGTNRWSVNDLPLAKRGTSYAYGSWMGADAYIANTYVDYTFACKDDYYDDLPYKIHVNITDINSSPTNPVVNHFNTWAEAP